MSVPSVRRAIETSFGANVSAFVDIEVDLLHYAWSRPRAARASSLMAIASGLTAWGHDPSTGLRARTVGSSHRTAALVASLVRSLGPGVQHFPEGLPARAGPSLQAHLRPDHILGIAGVDLDAGQRSRNDEVLQVLGLRKNILARQ